MAEWLFGQPSVEPVPEDPNQQARYFELHHLVIETIMRLAKTLEVAAWQRRAGWQRTVVWLETEFTKVTAPQPYGIEFVVEHGTEEIKCRLRLPDRWLAGPVDAVMALRMKLAVLRALDAVGERFGFGPVPVRKSPLARTELDIEDMFAIDAGTGPYEGVADRIGEIVSTLGEEDAVVLAKAQVPRRAAGGRERLMKRMGVVTALQSLTTDHGKELHAWTLRLR